MVVATGMGDIETTHHSHEGLDPVDHISYAQKEIAYITRANIEAEVLLGLERRSQGAAD